MLKILNYSVVTSNYVISKLRHSVNLKLIRWSTRNLSIKSGLSAKFHIEHENQFAHNVLKDNINYHVLRDVYGDNGTRPAQFQATPSIIDYVKTSNWEAKNITELMSGFSQIVRICRDNNLCISNEIFDSFVKHFILRCSSLTDDQLISALQHLIQLPVTESPSTRNYLELWSALDAICCNRIPNWDSNYVLYVCDHWYRLHLAKQSKFMWASSNKFGRKIKKLPPNQLVQTMFYCNLIRQPVIEMHDFEQNMKNVLEQLSINEIAVMCMGFFKTQTKLLESDFLDKIYIRLKQEVDTIQDIPLVNILKILRYSSKLPQEPVLFDLLDTLVPQIPRLSLLSCLHIALAGSDLQLCHMASIHPIIERFARELQKARLKDMERISFVMGLYDVQTESGIEMELCKNILLELKTRVREIALHPRCFAICLHFLTMKFVSDNEMISSVLHPKFVHNAYGNNMLNAREIFCLDMYARINLKGRYSGNLLNDRLTSKMGKFLSHYIPDRNSGHKVTNADRLLLDMTDTVQELYNDYSHLCHALPHYQRPDLLIAFNVRTRNEIDIRSCYPVHYTGTLLTRDFLLRNRTDADDLVIINIIIGGWNQYVRYTDKPTGLLKLKLEQSRLCGLHPIVISFDDWVKLTVAERRIFVKHKIDLAIDDEIKSKIKL